jgi:intermediate peptidase
MTTMWRSYLRNRPHSYVNDLFGIGGLKRSQDFPRIAAARVENARNVMNEWKLHAGTKDAVKDIHTLDNVSNSLCQIADAAEFIRNVESDPEWIEGASSAVQEVSSFMNEANLSSDYYDKARAIQSLLGRSEHASLEHKNVINSMAESMRNEGVNLPKESKSRLITLQSDDIVKSFNIVQSNGTSESGEGVWIRKPDNLPTSKLSFPFPKRVSGGIEEICVPGDSALLGFILKQADCRSTRQALWEAGTRQTDSAKVRMEAMTSLVEIRREMANIRGYQNWNEYAQRESVLGPLGGSSAVKTFLTSLWTEMTPGIARELNALSSIHDGSSVEPWDIDYLMRKWKDYNRESLLSTELIESKLTFARVLAGAQQILDRLLNVDMQYDKTSGPLWHKDAFRLSLARGPKDPFAYLYIDPYARETKSVQSAQFTLSGSKLLSDGTRQKPQTALVLNLPSHPEFKLPIQLAQTFFHELGHAMHSLLSETSLQHFSGSRGAIDFVEFPSHLFEFFATDPDSLRELLKNEIDPTIIDHYAANRNAFAHIEAAQQLTYALVDQVFYETGSFTNLSEYLPPSAHVDKTQLLKILQPTSVANFEHLVHYGGSYYCYLLCRALAADVWKKSFRASPFDSEAGQRLGTFLKGGSVDQSLAAIYSIVPEQPPVSSIPIEPLLSDLSSCRAIHSAS